MKKLIEIDGSFGEGGGQILRSSLSLSMLTQQPFLIKKIRAGRKNPGLMRQHLTAVKAAAKICNARVCGAEISSLRLEFYPGEVRPGKYEFNIGSAGSTTLVIQTLLPVLMTGERESEIIISGGTHNQFSPPLDFLENVFFKQIRRMGVVLEIKLERYGFYPVGGGKYSLRVKPIKSLNKIELLEKGDCIGKRAIAYTSLIPKEIGCNEMKIIAEKLGWDKNNCESREVKSPGPGNVVLLIDENEYTTEAFTGFGRALYSLHKVTRDVLIEYADYIDCDVPVYKHLADQLIIPMALAGQGKFITSEPSMHTLTNIEVVKKFLGINITIRKINGRQWLLNIGND